MGSGGAAGVADAGLDGGAAVGPKCGDGHCNPDQYCDFANDSCGAIKTLLTCVPTPTDCPGDDTASGPACGCDGAVYAGPCAAPSQMAASYPSRSPGTPSSPPQRPNWRWIGGGLGIHWPVLDEDLSIRGMLGA